jgi:hypothetical protein
MKLANHLASLTIAMSLVHADAGAAVTAEAEGTRRFSVKIRPHETPLVSGTPAWYDVKITNITDAEQIIDLAVVDVVSTSFVDLDGANGHNRGGVYDKVRPQECTSNETLTVIKPGQSIVVLAKIDTPEATTGLARVAIAVVLSRIVDLKNCADERIRVSDRFKTQVQPAHTKRP